MSWQYRDRPADGSSEHIFAPSGVWGVATRCSPGQYRLIVTGATGSARLFACGLDRSGDRTLVCSAAFTGTATVPAIDLPGTSGVISSGSGAEVTLAVPIDGDYVGAVMEVSSDGVTFSPYTIEDVTGAVVTLGDSFEYTSENQFTLAAYYVPAVPGVPAAAGSRIEQIIRVPSSSRDFGGYVLVLDSVDGAGIIMDSWRTIEGASDE